MRGLVVDTMGQSQSWTIIASVGRISEASSARSRRQGTAEGATLFRPATSEADGRTDARHEAQRTGPGMTRFRHGQLQRGKGAKALCLKPNLGRDAVRRHRHAVRGAVDESCFFQGGDIVMNTAILPR